MLNRKLILSLTVTATFCTSSLALAFQGQSHARSDKTASTAIYVNNETLENSALEFISNMTQNGIGILQNTGLSEEARKKQFRTLLQDNFDMKTIGRFALGRYWKISSEAERKEYLSLFEDMIVDVYSKRFRDYNGQKINVISAQPEGKSDVVVSSAIIPETGQKINVHWRVRKNKENHFKIIDIIVEGVSMSLTQRSDFASVIQRGGGKIEVLLSHLRSAD